MHLIFSYTQKTTKNGSAWNPPLQGSKVFRRAGPFPDIYKMTAREAKKAIWERTKDVGELTGFEFYDEKFPREPKTFFYDWIYINALSADEWLAEKIEQYKRLYRYRIQSAKINKLPSLFRSCLCVFGEK